MQFVKPQFKKAYEDFYLFLTNRYTCTGTEYIKNKSKNGKKRIDVMQEFFDLVDKNQTFIDYIPFRTEIQQTFSTGNSVPLKNCFPPEILLIILSFSGVKPVNQKYYQLSLNKDIFYQYKIGLYELIKTAETQKLFRIYAKKWQQKIKSLNQKDVEKIQFTNFKILIVTEKKLYEEYDYQPMLFKKCSIEESDQIIDFDSAIEEGYYGGEELFRDSDHMTLCGGEFIDHINCVSLLPTWALSYLEFMTVLQAYCGFDIEWMKENIQDLEDKNIDFGLDQVNDSFSQGHYGVQIGLLQVCGFRKSKRVGEINCLEDIFKYQFGPIMYDSNYMFINSGIEIYSPNTDPNDLLIYVYRNSDSPTFSYWPADDIDVKNYHYEWKKRFNRYDSSSSSQEVYDSESESVDENDLEETKKQKSLINGDNKQFKEEEKSAKQKDNKNLQTNKQEDKSENYYDEDDEIEYYYDEEDLENENDQEQQYQDNIKDKEQDNIKAKEQDIIKK